jgi:hypothetical protein
MQVRLFLQATSSSQVCEGACLTLGSSLWAALPEIGVVGTIQSCVEKQPISGDLCGGQFSNHKQGVIMTVTQEPQVLPASGGGIGVRIDLGSLELTVDEIAALSPGVRIELDGSFPAECFLRVGATVLARGVLEQGEGGFALRVQQVFE